MQERANGVADGRRVEQNTFTGERLGKDTRALRVVGRSDACVLQVLHHRGIGEFFGVDVKRHRLVRHGQIRGKDGRAGDVAASEIGKPRNVFERAQQQGLGPGLVHGLSDTAHFLLHAFLAVGEHKDGFDFSGGSLEPDAFHDGGVARHFDAALGKAAGEPLKDAFCQGERVTGKFTARGEVLLQPALRGRNASRAQAHELNAAAFELPGGLLPVAAVGP